MSATVDCPELERWETLLSGDVPALERDRYEKHLEACPLCQERLDRLSGPGAPIFTLIGQIPDPPTLRADPVLTQVMERLHDIKQGERRDNEDLLDLFFLGASDRPNIMGTLGDFEVQEVIGVGGMGVVLKAYEPSLQRTVAIKVMSASVAGSALARRRFTREAKAAAAVCHEHIVPVYGVCEKDGLPYLVMQHVPGESLQAKLDRAGPLEVAEIVRIGFQTASGLAAAHAQGLIHRDIKPGNLLLETDALSSLPRVKITDFGLARMADDVRLTQADVVAGTPDYMSPEQAHGETVDGRSDLFSLGSVLYAMCTGQPPFSGGSALALLRHVSDETPPSIRAQNPSIPMWLETFIGRLMAKKPAERLQSAAEVAALLEGYLAHLRQPASVPPPAVPGSPLVASDRKPEARPRRRARTWFFAVVLVGILLGMAFFGLSALNSGVTEGNGAQAGGPQASDPQEDTAPKLLSPRNGLTCLVVNNKSGRCLSVADGSIEPGAKLVQGPTRDQALAGERWLLLSEGADFLLMGVKSGLFLQIPDEKLDNGTQATLGKGQRDDRYVEEKFSRPNQVWRLEPTKDGYLLRAKHSQKVLAIAEGSEEAGGPAVQREHVPDSAEETWTLQTPKSFVKPIEKTPAKNLPVVEDVPEKTVLPPEPPNHKSVYACEYYHSFKDDREIGDEFHWHGLDPQDCVLFEPEGLRITLPRGHPGKRMGTGIGLKTPVQGDFEITMSYEMIKEPDFADAGQSTGLFVWVDQNLPTMNRGLLGRVTWPGKQYITWMHLSPEGDKQPVDVLRGFPTKDVRGRLRLVRTGPDLYYYSAEGASDQFTLLQQYEYGTTDLGAIRWGGETGGAEAALEGRFIDLRIRADALPNLASAKSGEDAAKPISSRLWLLAVLGVGAAGLVLVGSAVGIPFFMRRRRSAAVTESTDKPPVPLIVACADCGRKLKIKSALAGKKIKCSQCGKVMLVPQS